MTSGCSWRSRGTARRTGLSAKVKRNCWEIAVLDRTSRATSALSFLHLSLLVTGSWVTCIERQYSLRYQRLNRRFKKKRRAHNDAPRTCILCAANKIGGNHISAEYNFPRSCHTAKCHIFAGMRNPRVKGRIMKIWLTNYTHTHTHKNDSLSTCMFSFEPDALISNRAASLWE